MFLLWKQGSRNVNKLLKFIDIMEKKCIACGGKLKDIAFTGKIEEMEIDFCEAHADWCDNCETMTLKIIKD